MNIPISDLKKFQKLSSSIASKNILPILDYIKVSIGKLTKSVNHAFVQMDCESADKEMLLDEKQLTAKINNTSATFLNFVKKANKVTISDTVAPKTFQVPEVKEFPDLPQPTSERFAVSKNFLSVLGKAAHFAKNMDTTPEFVDYVMVGNGTVCATDRHVFFYEEVEEQFKLVIEKKCAAFVATLDITDYAHSDSYMFFYGPGLEIGFSVQEIGYTDLTKYADLKDSKCDFIGSVSDFRQFNNECRSSSDVPWITIKDGSLEMNDTNRDVFLERKMEGIKPSRTFTYNPDTMNQLLSAIDVSEIEFYRGPAFYWIKSPDHKFTTLLMELATKE